MAKPLIGSYGKAAVGVYRSGGAHPLFAAEVAIEVAAESLSASYTAGDNAAVVATDSMKNFVHATALEYDGDSLEDFLLLVGRRFLARYEHLERVALRGRELTFARAGDGLYQRTYDDHGVAEVALDRDGVASHRSGREGLHLVKLTGSAFTGFVRDEFTTLPEMADRPLFVHLDVYWRHAAFERRVAGEAVRSSVVATFEDFVSESIQHLVHEMGVRLLAEQPAIAEVSFRAENRLWDTALVSEDEAVRVYTDARPPYGVIALTLAR